MIAPNDLEAAVRLAAAVLCGGAIGIERNLRRMPTGFRTMALVSLGAAIAVLAAIKAGEPDGFSRVAQGIVTGIGFLGAGVILHKGTHVRSVKGLTTATAIWVTAAIGLLCGLGELKIAAIATFMVLLVLVADNAMNLFLPQAREPAGPDETHDNTD